MEVLSNGRVHDATCQDVGETTVVTCTPVGMGETDKLVYIAIIITLLCSVKLHEEKVPQVPSLQPNFSS